MANIITYCRILCSISMMSFHMPSISFFLLYMICGLSDVLDGIIARKTNTASDFGARLDTIADFIFATVLLSNEFYAKKAHKHIDITTENMR